MSTNSSKYKELIMGLSPASIAQFNLMSPESIYGLIEDSVLVQAVLRPLTLAHAKWIGIKNL